MKNMTNPRALLIKTPKKVLTHIYTNEGKSNQQAYE